jgi:hypothetical protein
VASGNTGDAPQNVAAPASMPPMWFDVKLPVTGSLSGDGTEGPMRPGVALPSVKFLSSRGRQNAVAATRLQHFVPFVVHTVPGYTPAAVYGRSTVGQTGRYTCLRHETWGSMYDPEEARIDYQTRKPYCIEYYQNN